MALDKRITMNQVVAVVVTYNRKELLRQNLKAILEQVEIGSDIIVVDNASSDGTDSMIQNDFSDPRIKYFNTGENLGGAGGFQYGVRKAMEFDYSYVWIMDDDTIPKKDALVNLMKAWDNVPGQCGALSSMALWTDGSVCKANRQKKTLFSFVSDDEYQNSNLIPVEMASFVSLLVKTEVIKQVGLPIGEYFIWTDDYEYTGRINRFGYSVVVVPDSKVVHKMKENKKINFAKESEDRIDRYKYVYRNDVHCYRQYGFKGHLYLVLKTIYTVFNIIIKSPKGRIKKIRVLCEGIKTGLSFNPEIEIV